MVGLPRTDKILRDSRKVGKVLARVGDKWSVLIIVLLGDGPVASTRSNGASMASRSRC